MKNNFSARGFTLIELLVVVAIIGGLAALILVSLTSVKSKARDAQRKSDINQLRIAVQLYATSNNGNLPDGGTAYHSFDAGSDWDPLFKTIMSPYMKKLPIDPYKNDTDYYYGASWFDAADTSVAVPCRGHYIVWAYLENATDSDPDKGLCVPDNGLYRIAI